MSPPSKRQPIFNIPAAVLVPIVAMAAIQAVRDALSDRLDADLLARFAFVPGRFTYAVDPTRVLDATVRLRIDGAVGQQAFAVARFFLGDGSPQPWTAVTYALLHGGWTHLGLNAVWLLAFGAPVARRLGVARFILFLAVGAVVGAASHWCVDPTSLQPLVGASAAVSACMGAALRFMFQPPRDPAAAPDDPASRPGRGPRLGLVATFRDRRALVFVVVWFLTNMATGIAAVPFGLSAAPIAWQAHVGGFLIGLLAFPLFDPRVPPPTPVPPPAEQPAEP